MFVNMRQWSFVVAGIVGMSLAGFAQDLERRVLTKDDFELVGGFRVPDVSFQHREKWYSMAYSKGGFTTYQSENGKRYFILPQHVKSYSVQHFVAPQDFLVGSDVESWPMLRALERLPPLGGCAEKG